MKDLIQCAAARSDFLEWLASETAPATVWTGEASGILLLKLEKGPSADYLYMTPTARNGGISWDSSPLFCGVYDRETQMLYLAKDAQSVLTKGQAPLAEKSGPSVLEEINDRINHRVEGIIANDRNNLPVQEVTGWQAARDLQYYREHGARSEALQYFFTRREPDGQFHSGYTLDELPEAAFMAWLKNPEGFIQTEAEAYIKTNQEKFLLQFLENEALLAEYQALAQDTGNPVHRRKAISDAIKTSGAKTVTVTVQKEEGELTFRTQASSLTGQWASYSTYDIPAADRRAFEQVFGRQANYGPEDIIKITYGRNTIYEALPTQTEEMAEGMRMGGM